MATTVNVARTEDILPVGSRVSWGAIFAGAMVALALYLLFSVLGTAIGLTVSKDVEADELGTGAAIYAILVNLIALFVGGWVTSQCAVGENKLEAAVYGVILWGLVFAILLWLMVSGVRMGFNAVISEASGSGQVAAPQITSDGLRSVGIGPGQAQTPGAPSQPPAAGGAPADLRSVASDPRTVEAAWWTFAGILLSMLAAIGGALAGSGPSVILRRVVVASSPAPLTPPI